MTFLAKFLLLQVLGVSAGICHTDLMDESEMNGTQMGTHNKSETGRSAWDALYDTTS
jgi:hypothetical protein